MISILQDLRYAIRIMLKRPVAASTAILILALGIGANSAIFSVVNAVLLRPLPFMQPERLVQIWESHPQHNAPRYPVSYPNFVDLRGQNRSFDHIAAIWNQPLNLSGGEEAEQVWSGLVSADFFPTLGVQPLKGRVFSTEDDTPGSDPTVIISYKLWQRYFGGNSDLIGQKLILNNYSYTVIAIMPPGFNFPDNRDVWTPIELYSARLQNRAALNLMAIGRLKPGISLNAAQADMSAIMQRLAIQYPELDLGQGATLAPLQDSMVESFRPALLVLLAAVLFVLIIACANVATITLVTGLTRQKEVAIRSFVGANRRRIMRQLLTESLLFSLIAGGFGVLLAYWCVNLLANAAPGAFTQFGKISLDFRVLGFALLISLVTGVLSGLVPALQASQPNLSESLKEGGRSSSAGPRVRRSINILAVAEIALTLMLMIGAGLMIKSFIRLRNTDPGIDARNLLTLQISLPGSKYPEGQPRIDFYRRLLESLSTLSGVESVAAINPLPFGADYGASWLYLDGHPVEAGKAPPLVNYRVVTPAYFRTLGIPLLEGRDFTERDARDSPGVVIVSKEMARRYWPGENPMEKRIKVGPPDSPWLTVVGIVGDVKNYDLAADIQPEAYTSYFQAPGPARTMGLVIRSASNTASLVSAVRNTVKTIDAQQPIFDVRTMEEVLYDSILLRRYGMLLIGLFAGLALLLASLGVYSVISYVVTMRTHEIGIRIALGAQRSDVLKLVIKQGLVVVVLGVGLGALAAMALSRLVSGLLYGVSPTDPMTFFLAGALFMIIAILAIYIPARRATTLNPLTVLSMSK